MVNPLVVFMRFSDMRFRRHLMITSATTNTRVYSIHIKELNEA